MATSQKFRTDLAAHIARGALRNASLKTERETTMKTTTKNTGIKVNASVKAGGLVTPNHSRSGLKVKAGIKAGTTSACRITTRRSMEIG